MVLSAVSNNGSTKLTGTNKSSSYKNASSAVVLTQAESRDPESDDDDASDDEAYNDFLSFLSTPPGSTNVTPELNEKKELVVEKKEEVKVVKKDATPVVVSKQPVVKQASERRGKRDVAVIPTEKKAAIVPEVKTVEKSISQSERAPRDKSSTVSTSDVLSASTSGTSARISQSSSTKPSEPVLRSASSSSLSAAELRRIHQRIAAVVLSSEASVATEYFTKKAAEDDELKKIEMRKLAKENMPEAHKHFDKIAHEDAVKRAAEVEELVNAPRPAAVEYFTAMDISEKSKRKLQIEEEANVPPPAAVSYFTTKANEEREKKAAELAELKANPPPASVATEYFAKKESQRQLEIEAMMNEPAPAAIEYFTNKAREEKSKRDLMLKEMNENPPEPSVATQYFARQESIKAAEIEAARSQVKNKEPLEPLPIDYFTKEAEREMAVRAESARQLAESQMPIAVKKMTAKAEADKIARDLERRELSERNMSAATRHFKEIEDEKIAQAAANAKDSAEIMPAAIQRFTMMDREKRAEKRASLQEMKENPPPMPDGIDYFTTKANEERERKAAELAELKANPPPASVATEYFAKKESQRQLEIEAMMNEPAPAAIEYFTNKAREEKSKRDLMLKEMNENPPEPSVATQYFARQESIKAAEIEAARSQVRSKTSVEPLPIDYFTKLGKKEMEEKALSKRKLAESQMPIATKKFTESDELAKSNHVLREDAPVATQHFHRIEAEAKAAVVEGEVEIMPAAIQHFTIKAMDESMKKKAALEEMKLNPPPMAPGVAHFTTVSDQ